jgi:hypothetical protein
MCIVASSFVGKIAGEAAGETARAADSRADGAGPSRWADPADPEARGRPLFA